MHSNNYFFFCLEPLAFVESSKKITKERVEACMSRRRRLPHSELSAFAFHQWIRPYPISRSKALQEKPRFNAAFLSIHRENVTARFFREMKKRFQWILWWSPWLETEDADARKRDFVYDSFCLI